jgi:hypothetical protein
MYICFLSSIYKDRGHDPRRALRHSHQHPVGLFLYIVIYLSTYSPLILKAGIMDMSPKLLVLLLLFIGSTGTTSSLMTILSIYAMDYLTSHYSGFCMCSVAGPSTCGFGDGVPVAEPQISWPLHE